MGFFKTIHFTRSSDDDDDELLCVFLNCTEPISVNLKVLAGGF